MNLSKWWSPFLNTAISLCRLLLDRRDRPSQKAAFLFLLSLGVTCITFGALIKQIRGRSPSHLASHPIKHLSEAPSSLLFFCLGKFTLEIQAAPQEPLKPGSLHTAEIEISLAYKDPRALAYLSDHQTELRNQATSVFLPLTQEDLLSREGKKRLKRKLLKRLNHWIREPLIEELHFSQLSLY